MALRNWDRLGRLFEPCWFEEFVGVADREIQYYAGHEFSIEARTRAWQMRVRINKEDYAARVRRTGDNWTWSLHERCIFGAPPPSSPNVRVEGTAPTQRQARRAAEAST